MSGSTSSSVLREQIHHLSVDECKTAIRALLDWWRNHPNHSGDETTKRLMPLAVTLHELRELVFTFETKACRMKTGATSPAPESGTDVTRFRRRPLVPWNARTNGRLKSLLLKYHVLIAQPQLKVVGTGEAGFDFQVLPGDALRDVNGLRRALDSVIGISRAHGQQMHSLVYLDSVSLAEEVVGLERPRAVHVRLLFDLEHAIELSIKRIDRLHRFRSDPCWRDCGPSEDAVQQLLELRALRQPNLNQWRWSRDYDRPTTEKNRLACVLAVANTKDPAELEIKSHEAFWGYENVCLQRLSTVLNYDLAKTRIARNHRRTTVLQFGWIQTAILERGDCAFERRILREALCSAQCVEDDPSFLGHRTIIAIALTDGDDWKEKALAELKFVLAVWADHRAGPKGRQARREQRKTLTEKSKVIGVWLDPHEGHVWRSSRSSSPPTIANLATGPSVDGHLDG
jgi:hypothetical protein